MLEKKVLENMPLRRVEMNKNNELIHITFNHKPSPMQRKIWDVVLYQAKNELERLKREKPKKYEAFKEDSFKDFFLPMKVDLNFLMSAIRVDRHNKKVLIENIRAISKIQIEEIIYYGEKTKMRNDTLEKYAHRIDGIDYENIKKWRLNHIMINPSIDFEEETFACYLSPLIVQFVDKKKDYTRIDVLVNAFFGSTYTINLYEILLNKFKAKKEMMEKGKIEKSDLIETAYFDIDDFKKMVGVNEDHSFYTTMRFNERILSRAVQEINNTDVAELTIANVNFKKKKRKIVAISFVLQERTNRQIPFLQGEKVVTKTVRDIIYNGEKESAGSVGSLGKADTENKSNEIITQLRSQDIKFVHFVNLLKQLKNTDLANNIDGYEPQIIVRTNDLGFLELCDPLNNLVIELDSKKDFERLNALKVWLYRNREKIGKLEQIDLKKAKWDKEIGKYMTYQDANGYYFYVLIKSISENGDLSKNSVLLKIIGEDVLRKKEITIEIEKEKFNQLQKTNELNKALMQELVVKNRQKRFEELYRIFEEHREYFADYVDTLTEKLFEFEPTSKEYYALNKILFKATEIATEERGVLPDDLDMLEHFYGYLKKRGLVSASPMR